MQRGDCMSNKNFSESFEEMIKKAMKSTNEYEAYDRVFTTHGGIINEIAAKHEILNEVIVPAVNDLLSKAGMDPKDFILEQHCFNQFMNIPLNYSLNDGTFAPIYYDRVQDNVVYRTECRIRIYHPDKSSISVSVAVLQLGRHEGLEGDENSEWEILFCDGRYYVSPFCGYNASDIVTHCLNKGVEE